MVRIARVSDDLIGTNRILGRVTASLPLTPLLVNIARHKPEFLLTVYISANY